MVRAALRSASPEGPVSSVTCPRRHSTESMTSQLAGPPGRGGGREERAEGCHRASLVSGVLGALEQLQQRADRSEITLVEERGIAGQGHMASRSWRSRWADGTHLVLQEQCSELPLGPEVHRVGQEFGGNRVDAKEVADKHHALDFLTWR